MNAKSPKNWEEAAEQGLAKLTNDKQGPDWKEWAEKAAAKLNVSGEDAEGYAELIAQAEEDLRFLRQSQQEGGAPAWVARMCLAEARKAQDVIAAESVAAGGCNDANASAKELLTTLQAIKALWEELPSYEDALNYATECGRIVTCLEQAKEAWEELPGKDEMSETAKLVADCVPAVPE